MNKKILITSSIGLFTATSLVASSVAMNVKQHSNVNIPLSSPKIKNEEIVARPIARAKTAWGWTKNDITDENFYNLPKSSSDKLVKVISVDNYPDDAKIDITIQFSTLMQDQISVVNETRIYSVTGFAKETLEQKVERLYSKEIIPTKQAMQIPAIEENWTLSDINDKNFENLPVSKDGIEVKLLSLSFDNSNLVEGKIILNYSFSWYEGVNTIEKSFEVSGFEIGSYNSNLAAQNHYKLVALYRMLSLKSNINVSRVNTMDIEEGGIELVKQYFNVPEDREFNAVSLEEVISSEDNSYSSFVEGKNMKLGTLKFRFSIYDWVNNVRSVVETQLFSGFENPLDFWKSKFESNVSLSSPIIKSLFSYELGYLPLGFDPYGLLETYDHETGEYFLNATQQKHLSSLWAASYMKPLADWEGFKISSRLLSMGHGERIFGLHDYRPNHRNFVDMITYDAKKNYIGRGPDQWNTIETPIKRGGITELLRRYLFNSTTNQELYQYDWIVFNKMIEPGDISNSLVWDYYDSTNGMPFGYFSVWLPMQFEYDVWLDYEKITIKFNVSLGMVDAGKISWSNMDDSHKVNYWVKTY